MIHESKDRKKIDQNQNNESIALIAKSIEKIADVFAEKNKQPIKYPWWKFWKHKYEHKHVIAYILMSLALVGFWSNWRSDIIAAQIEQVKEERNMKLVLQNKLTASIMHARIVVLSQGILCESNKNKKSLSELKVDRLESLENLVALNAGTKDIYNPQVQEEVGKIVEKIYGINNVCLINTSKFDDELRAMLHIVIKLIDVGLKEDDAKILLLTKQRHRLEIPIEL